MARAFMRVLMVAVIGVLAVGCAGMNRAVTVAPQTMDDLGRKTEPFRQGRT